MIREIIALYGREGLGSLWVIVDPLTFALPILILWHFIRAQFEHGIPMMAFMWSGYMPLLLFRHVGGRMQHFIRQNAGLMYHRDVTVLDIFIARASVEIVQNISAGALLYAIFYLFGLMDLPDSIPMAIIGYTYMIWWCVAVGLIIGALSERSELVDKLWQPFSYSYILWGGTWYLVSWLPTQMQAYASWLPSVQAYEMLRSGILGPSATYHFDFVYESFLLGILTLYGLSMLKSGRRYITVD